VIRLGNVSTPQLTIHRPEPRLDTGAAVLICPGGGFNILAYDLEGTEVAAWLNGLGVTGIVLKYRVPARDPARRWLAAVQDAQRAMSLVRSKAGEWGLRADRLGILGFSAGGATAAYTALASERLYPAIDAVDRIAWRPDFALLIYTAGFVERRQTTLSGVMPVGAGAPPRPAAPPAPPLPPAPALPPAPPVCPGVDGSVPSTPATPLPPLPPIPAPPPVPPLPPTASAPVVAVAPPAPPPVPPLPPAPAAPPSPPALPSWPGVPGVVPSSPV
jgi:acetyl esterase/lipase